MRSPAFERDGANGWRPTADTERVLTELGRVGGGKPFTVRAANSVEAMDGQPLWGTGFAFVPHKDGQMGQEGLVDPLLGNTNTVAHEGAHAVASTPISQDSIAHRLHAPVWPKQVPRDSGARLRYFYNVQAAPVVAEEAHANGVADGITDRLGLPRNALDASDSLAYPTGYARKAIDDYRSDPQVFGTVGPSSPGELEEMRAIGRSSHASAERQYAGGYQLGRGN